MGPSVLKCETARMCLTEEVPVLDKLCSGMYSSVVGPKFSVDESAIYIKLGVFT